MTLKEIKSNGLGLHLCRDEGDLLGLFGATPVGQHSTDGETTGFTAGAGTAAKDDSTFTGNVGATAYTIGDIVAALKNLGLMAP